MTPEELLKPRYKVIADYPFNRHFKVGEVVTLNQIDDREHLPKEFFVTQSEKSDWPSSADVCNFHESYFNKFPNIFKKLEWWEDRKPEEKPEYVKNEREVNKVVFLECNSLIIVLKNTLADGAEYHSYILDARYYQPATKEEYEAQLK